MHDLKNLVSGMFSDYLDQKGYDRCVHTGLSPFKQSHKAFGRVRTMKLVDAPGQPENIELGLSFLEKLNANEVLCVDASAQYAYFGELMTRMSLRQGLAGAIINGLTRDSSFVAETDFPVFSAGLSPVDIKGRGRVAEVDVTIVFGKLVLEPYTLVFADNDAIVAIPKEIEDELLQELPKIINEESEIIRRINAGEPVSSILNFHKSF